jgi:hypothetical protein
VSCRANPVAWTKPRIDVCYQCLPGGPFTPPPCRRCGATSSYYSAGLCGRCHLYAPQHVESCRDCYGWGVLRKHKWLCWGCRSWRQRNPPQPCVVCGRTVAVKYEGVCRLCWRGAARLRRTKPGASAAEANQHGQQLFLANLFLQREAKLAHPRPGADASAATPFRPDLVTHRQQVLVWLPWDLHAVLANGLPDPKDAQLGAFLHYFVGEFAARHGWSRNAQTRVRQAVRLLLGLQDTPGAAIKASEVALLVTIGLPVSTTLAILTEAGLLEDDRPSTLDGWFDRQLAGLPQPMADELRLWYELLRNGIRTPPRMRRKVPVTIRTRLRWALPMLHAWAQAGHQSLREVSYDDVLAVLPAGGIPRATAGTALRSIFGVLKARKLIFTNPVARIPTGHTETREPLPMDVALLREALHAEDPERAALAALLAFHGLRFGKLRDLLLTDVHDGRLRLDGRTILLADPVRQRLAAYLDYRNRRWPNTANPHLFLNVRSATHTRGVDRNWVRNKLGISVQAIREDCILHEAHATHGDVRRLCDLFGLSVKAAERYTATVDHPALSQTDTDQPPG